MAAPFDQVHATKKQRLGTRKRDVAGNEYIYLQGVASVVAGSWVSFDELGVTTLLDTDVAASMVAPIAVAQAAVDATTEYGWFMIFGKTQANVEASFADNSKIFAVATAGSADDSGTAGNQIVGAYGRSAISSGQATVQLVYPVCGVNVA
jgi:hypothetical protein